MEDTYILEMSHIVKTFPGVRALGDGCLRLKKGETHALIGENGAGKSTLMKILLGDYPADSGEILYKGKRVAFSSPNQANHAGICMIPQEVNMVETMDAAENVWLHREKRFSTCGFINKKKRLLATQELFDRMHLNLDPKKLVAQYSSAQKQMLAIAKAVSQDSEVIIMDEPTSSLSESEVQMLFAVMRELQSKGVSIVFISHKIEEIFTICQTITVLRDGMFISEHPVGEITREDLITQIAGRKIGDMYPPKRQKFGEIAFEVKNFSEHGIYRDISFSVRRGEILGLYGLVGAGRSEVMRAVYGVDTSTLLGTQAVDVDDDIKTLVEFENGATGTLWSSRFCLGHEDSLDIEIYGSKGSARFSRERPNELEFYSSNDPSDERGFHRIKMGPEHPNGELWPMADLGIGYVEQKCVEYRDFFRAVALGDPSLVSCSFYDGYKVCQFIDAAKQSSREGGWVVLENI